ncbi:MAG: hypothetical protein CSA26_01295 [Desulfobacterales bacterium]|nr:MAG: hypothetical protein CSA26_01295 [Desulfobacterales bacterium]
MTYRRNPFSIQVCSFALGEKYNYSVRALSRNPFSIQVCSFSLLINSEKLQVVDVFSGNLSSFGMKSFLL